MSDGNNGEQRRPPRDFLVVFACPCGNVFNLGLRMKPGAPDVLTIPEYRCTRCPGLPRMAQSVPKEAEPQLVAPVGIVPKGLKAL